jgi:hypothetical protein
VSPRRRSIPRSTGAKTSSSLAFTALRLEFGWQTTPIHSAKLANLNMSPTRRDHASAQLDAITKALIH